MEAEKYVVKNKELRIYDEREIEISERSFISMLEAFQIAVFSFLIATNEEGYKSFKELKEIFDSYFDRFKVEKNRLSRALDICLDIGFFKAKWEENKESNIFQRKFENKHEISHIFRQISENYKNGEIEENNEIFARYD